MPHSKPRKACNTPLSYPRQRLFDFIKETGPVSVVEIFFGLKLFKTMNILRGTMVQLRDSQKLGDECVYISGWRRDEDGAVGGVLRPLYSVGPVGTPDARKPPRLTNRERTARYYAKQKKFTPSVFHLGVPSYERRFSVRKTSRAQQSETG
jgi:hypothetical protein